jgi:hypothetical protein
MIKWHFIISFFFSVNSPELITTFQLKGMNLNNSFRSTESHRTLCIKSNDV